MIPFLIVRLHLQKSITLIDRILNIQIFKPGDKEPPEIIVKGGVVFD